MALRHLPYSGVAPVVRHYLKEEEGEDTRDLINALRPARKRGYLRKSELEKICRWKSIRAIRRVQSNSPTTIRRATARALATRSERNRLAALRELSGVSVPMASAILMLLNPKRYGVIDIRVWEILYAQGTVRSNPDGVGFSFNNWYQYLRIIRHFAKKHGVKARDVERALFDAHHAYQRGVLYRGRS